MCLTEAEGARGLCLGTLEKLTGHLEDWLRETVAGTAFWVLLHYPTLPDDPGRGSRCAQEPRGAYVSRSLPVRAARTLDFLGHSQVPCPGTHVLH